jgi:hypothetical protein
MGSKYPVLSPEEIIAVLKGYENIVDIFWNDLWTIYRIKFKYIDEEDVLWKRLDTENL